jgi:hypothetical protein
MTSKLEQLRAMRERGQGGVRAESRKRAASDRPAKAVTKAMLERAASAIPPKPRKKRRK